MFEKLKKSDLRAKDTFFRFINSAGIKRLNLATVPAAKLVTCVLERLTLKQRVNIFIINGTTHEKQHSLKAELLVRISDHANNKYTWDSGLLALCLSDGNFAEAFRKTVLLF